MEGHLALQFAYFDPFFINPVKHYTFYRYICQGFKCGRVSFVLAGDIKLLVSIWGTVGGCPQYCTRPDTYLDVYININAINHINHINASNKNTL